jgi:hypothetical protein
MSVFKLLALDSCALLREVLKSLLSGCMSRIQMYFVCFRISSDVRLIFSFLSHSSLHIFFPPVFGGDPHVLKLRGDDQDPYVLKIVSGMSGCPSFVRKVNRVA